MRHKFRFIKLEADRKQFPGFKLLLLNLFLAGKMKPDLPKYYSYEALYYFANFFPLYNFFSFSLVLFKHDTEKEWWGGSARGNPLALIYITLFSFLFSSLSPPGLC